MWPTHFLPRKNRPGTPPARFYFTTPPYPIEVVEELFAGGELLSAKYGIGANDDLLSSGEPLSGVLRTLLKTHDQPPEDELIAAGEPLSGVLRTLLVGLDGGHEELVASGEPLSGVLRDPLVVYSNWPLAVEEESLIASGVPLSGVLA